jgi:antitoxin (DNA-binding transcriptional repressor) of toxin-antitoxin stability system
MTRIGLNELKDRLDVYIAKVRAGETVVVTDEGEVIAELKPPVSSEKAALLDLARRGDATLGTPVEDRKAHYTPLPRLDIGVSSAELLEAVRGED